MITLSLGPNHSPSSQWAALLVKNTKALYPLSLELLTPIPNYCMRQKRSAINYISTYLDIISLTPSQREAAGASGLISNYQLHRTQRERGTPVVLIHNAEWYNKCPLSLVVSLPTGGNFLFPPTTQILYMD